MHPELCPYASNAFCASLDDLLRQELCAVCKQTRYASGSLFDSAERSNSFAVVLDGLLLLTDDSDDDAFSSPMLPMSEGQLVCCPHNWVKQECLSLMGYVILESHVACFPRETIQRLHDESPAFAWRVCDTLRLQMEEMLLALRKMGGKNPVCAVRFMLDFCKRHGGFRMTHSQLALATGLARPTVTKALAELTRESAELFPEFEMIHQGGNP